jgi:hypothetical protein
MFARRTLRNLGGSYIVPTDATRQLPPTSSDIPAHSGIPTSSSHLPTITAQMRDVGGDQRAGHEAHGSRSATSKSGGLN